MLFTWAVRDWKRAVDMKLSKRDDDLLYLVNHGERSALEDYMRRATEEHARRAAAGGAAAGGAADGAAVLSPLTREPLQPHLFPNVALRSQILEYHATRAAA